MSQNKYSSALPDTLSDNVRKNNCFSRSRRQNQKCFLNSCFPSLKYCFLSLNLIWSEIHFLSLLRVHVDTSRPGSTPMDNCHHLNSDSHRIAQYLLHIHYKLLSRTFQTAKLLRQSELIVYSPSFICNRDIGCRVKKVDLITFCLRSVFFLKFSHRYFASPFRTRNLTPIHRKLLTVFFLPD